jgi:hypothetical protein
MFEKLFRRIFEAPQEVASDSSIGFVLAARDLFGWTDASYEDVYEAAKLELKRGSVPKFEPEGTPQRLESRRQELLKYADVRRRLSSFQLFGEGKRARTITDNYSRPNCRDILGSDPDVPEQ